MFKRHAKVIHVSQCRGMPGYALLHTKKSICVKKLHFTIPTVVFTP